MLPGLLVKLRPSTPWRIGPASGARDRVDSIFHSDTLYSAVTHAMRLLGRLEYWLEITARTTPAQVRFSSMFPFHGDTLYVTPPKHIWPPPPSVRVHYAGARFVPMPLIESMFAGKPLEDDRWTVDGASQTLVPGTRPGPFRVSIRSSAAVDRLSGATEPHASACLEFIPKAGLWFAVQFADSIARDQWIDAVRSAIRLLADSGFGGERSRGWGRAHKPEFRDGALPHLVYQGASGGETMQWLLSLAVPAESDSVSWDRGSYSTSVRGGRIESPAASGAAKKLLTMIEEGSVLAADTLEGSAPNVAPDGLPHAAYHAGFAFSIAVPAEVPKQLETIAEAEPAALEAEEEIQTELPAANEEAAELDYAVAEIADEPEQFEIGGAIGPEDLPEQQEKEPEDNDVPVEEPKDTVPSPPEEEPDQNPPGPNPDEPEEPEGPIE